ncbi:MAG TPA: HEAT repeat domain-containing protein [Bacteroidia bacterium]|nr:HEAT repeat domain-containing protein [Bacteroidia bacterium]
MSFYDLTKEERVKLVEQINQQILSGIEKNKASVLVKYFEDEDTYIRKTAYLAIGKIYKQRTALQTKIITLLTELLKEEDAKIRQTCINAAGEIGIKDFKTVEWFFDTGLFDTHHSVRNAVIGSVKKMSEKNPKPTLVWAKKYLHHTDKEVRREICHGIELRGRTHPQDILPLLKELQYDKTARVKNTLIHVLGQIAYKKDCLETVIAHLNTWDDRELTDKAVDEIVDVHERYKSFAILTQKQAIKYIDAHYKPKK